MRNQASIPLRSQSWPSKGKRQREDAQQAASVQTTCCGDYCQHNDSSRSLLLLASFEMVCPLERSLDSVRHFRRRCSRSSVVGQLILRAGLSRIDRLEIELSFGVDKENTIGCLVAGSRVAIVPAGLHEV